MIHVSPPSGPGSTEQEPVTYTYIPKLHQKDFEDPLVLNVPIPCLATTRDTSPSEKMVTNHKSNVCLSLGDIISLLIITILS